MISVIGLTVAMSTFPIRNKSHAQMAASWCALKVWEKLKSDFKLLRQICSSLVTLSARKHNDSDSSPTLSVPHLDVFIFAIFD